LVIVSLEEKIMDKNIAVFKSTKDLLHKYQMERLEDKIGNLEMKCLSYQFYGFVILVIIFMSGITLNLYLEYGLDNLTIMFFILSAYIYVSSLYMVYKDYERK